MYSFTWIAKPVGCFKDTGRRAIPGVDGRYPIIRGYYRKRKDAIRRCALVALRFGYRAFAVQHQGWCATGPRAHLTYRKYGRSSRCRNGKGGPWANDVYTVTGKTEVHITLLSMRNTVKILRNERPKQSQCFSYHKLLMLSQRLSQVNLTGIFWSRELGWTKSPAKAFRIGPEVQIDCLNWTAGTVTDLLTLFLFVLKQWLAVIFVFGINIIWRVSSKSARKAKCCKTLFEKHNATLIWGLLEKIGEDWGKCKVL